MRLLVAGRASFAPTLSLALLLALASAKVSAAALGGLTTSVGLFAPLAAMLALSGWPGPATGRLMPATGAGLTLVIGAGLFWRTRRRQAATGLVPASARRLAKPGSEALPVVLPAGFERAGLLATARQHFLLLQSAWDAGDVPSLRSLTTRDMLAELCSQLAERGLEPNRTDVVTLQAALLGFEDLGSAYLMSVEFSGMICERSDAGAVAFSELWMLALAKQEAATWQLARQQALL